MNPLNLTTCARIIRRHYGLSRPVTPDEVYAEITNLIRRTKAGTLDDQDGYLAASLSPWSPELNQAEYEA